jgi:hypothetical protein
VTPVEAPGEVQANLLGEIYAYLRMIGAAAAPRQQVDEEADPARPAPSLIKEGLGDGTPTASP